MTITTCNLDEAMTVDASMAGDGGSRTHRLMGAIVTFVATITLGILVGAPSVSSSSVDECVKQRMDDGATRAVATARCVRESNTEPNTRTSAQSGGGETSGSDGVSTVVLIGVGVGGVLIGAGLATVLRRRVASTGRGVSAGPRVAGPGGAAPSMPGAATRPPVLTPPLPTPPDRSVGLVAALIDLADQVPSQALRAEVVAALGRAGVHPLEPAAGDVFDVTRMRGVGSARAPDVGWVGRVAGTERLGYHDGATLLRLPEVVVYTAGS